MYVSCSICHCVSTGLEADDISVRHCVIHNTDGEVGIECCEGLCYLNEQLVSQPAPSPLSHGISSSRHQVAFMKLYTSIIIYRSLRIFRC